MFAAAGGVFARVGGVFAAAGGVFAGVRAGSGGQGSRRAQRDITHVSVVQDAALDLARLHELSQVVSVAQYSLGAPFVHPIRLARGVVSGAHRGGSGRARRGRFVPYYLFTYRQPFEYLAGEVPRLPR
ncbi:hypothetical protein [Amycolatopsis viridis]|uniref:Secreted protein n=1 Tax=Amycolatopsis viridis TaxID=185678 RepID=A0ABX0T4L5_9PSEU|nr:hypothetical protein [Amycolatopsis viridis]NIH82855.1 hypothetical protein [Amycolatopsis viridis]